MFVLFFVFSLLCFFSFFFNATSTSEIYTLSLHDALPILIRYTIMIERRDDSMSIYPIILSQGEFINKEDLTYPFEERGLQMDTRSEEHTSELQSRFDLVCRLLLEKKKKNKYRPKRYTNNQ